MQIFKKQMFVKDAAPNYLFFTLTCKIATPVNTLPISEAGTSFDSIDLAIVVPVDVRIPMVLPMYNIHSPTAWP